MTAVSVGIYMYVVTALVWWIECYYYLLILLFVFFSF